MTFQRDDQKPQAVPATTKPASHDSATPKALVDFMLTGWKPGAQAAIKPLPNHQAFHARRRALSKLFPGETLVIPTGHEKVRSNDTSYPFRPGSDFFYLTGDLEPDCVLVLQPTAEGHRDVLFVEPNPGRADATFYTDRMKGELWVGPRLGVEQSRQRYSVDECRGLPGLPEALVAAGQGRFRLLRGFSASTDSALIGRADPDQKKRDGEFATALSEMRLLKDTLEIKELERVIDSTQRGFEDVIAALPRAISERTVEGVFNLRARVEGNDVGYGTIAAAGPHACILHWTRNDGKIDPRQLLLLDAGVEGTSLYTADVTRTLPIGGRFSREQREIYTLVWEAQAAAFKAVKPGNDFMEPNRQAMKVLAHGLEKLGILPMSADEALADQNQFYKRYSLHNVSHMLGIDVHDCAQARNEVYKFGKLQPGMVLTVEPGLYFQLDDLTVPARFRGIGVRIEDDVVVTAKGYRNLSGKIPSAPDDVEAWMKGIWSPGKAGQAGGKAKAKAKAQTRRR
jgi:Xaa-Pro aminopeptidase